MVIRLKLNTIVTTLIILVFFNKVFASEIVWCPYPTKYKTNCIFAENFEELNSKIINRYTNIDKEFSLLNLNKKDIIHKIFLLNNWSHICVNFFSSYFWVEKTQDNINIDNTCNSKNNTFDFLSINDFNLKNRNTLELYSLAYGVSHKFVFKINNGKNITLEETSVITIINTKQ